MEKEAESVEKITGKKVEHKVRGRYMRRKKREIEGRDGSAKRKHRRNQEEEQRKKDNPGETGGRERRGREPHTECFASFDLKRHRMEMELQYCAHNTNL